MADKALPISDGMINIIIDACKDAESTTNSKRNGSKFTFLERIDHHSIKLKLQSQTQVIPTKAIPSITRALLRNYKEHFPYRLYKGSILNATLDSQIIPSVRQLDDYQILQEITQIFFAKKDLDNWQKKSAEQVADKIRNILLEYVTNK